MADGIPDDREVRELLRGLSREDRDGILCAVDEGEAVTDPRHAGLAVAVARRRMRRALVLGLPFHVASAIAMGGVGFAITRTSAGFAFGFVLGVLGFVVYLWWAETWKKRRRALAVNTTLLETGTAPATPRAQSLWGMSFTLAWAFSMFVGGVLHFLLGAPSWIGMPLFVVFLILFRRLLRSTVRSIDEWGKR